MLHFARMKGLPASFSPVLGGIALLLLVALGFLGYRQLELSRANETLALAKTEADRYSAELLASLNASEQANRELTDALTLERGKNSVFEKRINDIAGTVGTLEKLATTDPELLAKYSKVYFLNENYIPTKLATIPSKYTFNESRTYQIHAAVAPILEDLLADAEEDGIDLKVVSAYRSFGTQAALKSGYTVSYGTGANRFSADQGYSEHQLGTTVDFTTPAVGASFVGFETTEAYAWLTKTAHRYGFILSYPAGNAFYQYEPWHWRYVGRALAEDLRDDDTHFYNLDQREIDEYLVNLFD